MFVCAHIYVHVRMKNMACAHANETTSFVVRVLACMHAVIMHFCAHGRAQYVPICVCVCVCVCVQFCQCACYSFTLLPLCKSSLLLYQGAGYITHDVNVWALSHAISRSRPFTAYIYIYIYIYI